MKKIELTAFDLASRFIGIKEIPGNKNSNQVMTFLTLDDTWPTGDEVPWCSAFVNYVCWILRLPRSKSLAARSWLKVGRSIQSGDAETGFDIVVLKRGGGGQPGPDVIDAPGHVGFFAGIEGNQILVLGGNQGDKVNVERFPLTQILGIRRIYD